MTRYNLTKTTHTRLDIQLPDGEPMNYIRIGDRWCHAESEVDVPTELLQIAVDNPRSRAVLSGAPDWDDDGVPLRRTRR